jgi:hypothetical protein
MIEIIIWNKSDVKADKEKVIVMTAITTRKTTVYNTHGTSSTGLP